MSISIDKKPKALSALMAGHKQYTDNSELGWTDATHKASALETKLFRTYQKIPNMPSW